MLEFPIYEAREKNYLTLIFEKVNQFLSIIIDNCIDFAVRFIKELFISSWKSILISKVVAHDELVLSSTSIEIH